MTEQLTPDHFRPHVDKVFRVKDTHHAFTLVSVDVRRREDWEAEMGLREPFNLIFRGPPGDVMREGPYVLDVDGGPSFELYVIPIFTPARDRQDYQAAFN